MELSDDGGEFFPQVLRGSVGEDAGQEFGDQGLGRSACVQEASRQPFLPDRLGERAPPAGIGVGKNEAAETFGMKTIELLRQDASPRQAEDMRPLDPDGVQTPC